MTTIHRLLVKLLGRVPPGDASFLHDDELLRRFHADRDQAAFEVLVWRHGSLVWGVCRRMIRDHHGAEDAFQATFLILARKGRSVRGSSCAGWLHQVARRVALRAIEKRSSVAEVALTDDVPDPVAHQDLTFLDGEIAALPDRIRQPLILCYLQQRTTEEAAKVLGIPRGTVLSRLSTARDKLAKRLARHGIAVPVLLVSALTAEQVAAVTHQAITWPGTLLPGSAFTLAHEVLTMTTWKPLVATAAVLFAFATFGGFAIVSAQQGRAKLGTANAEAKAVEAQKKDAEVEKKAVTESSNVSTKAEKIKQLIATTEKQLHSLYVKRIEIASESADSLGQVQCEIAIEEYQKLVQGRYKELREKVVLESNIEEAKANNDDIAKTRDFILREQSKLKSLSRSIQIADRQMELLKNEIVAFQRRSRMNGWNAIGELDQKIASLQKRLSDLEYLQMIETIDPEHHLSLRREASGGGDEALRRDIELLRAEVEKLRKAMAERK